MKVKVVLHDGNEYVVEVASDFSPFNTIKEATQNEEVFVNIGGFVFHVSNISRIVPAE